MKKTILFFTLLFVTNISLLAQEVQFYKNETGDQHLCGPFPIDYLKQDTTYAGWFAENYDQLTIEKKNYNWVKDLEGKEVDIYLGTWCGDSKKWVPQFVKLWDELGLKREQLNFVALYDTDSLYKQGPNGEEKGLKIHRVPTFIFKDNDKEFARIVEYPNTDLVTDLAQIALGYPSAPSYRGANHLLDLFEEMTVSDIYKEVNKHYLDVYYKIGKYNELNTLGNVLKYSGRKEEALLVFTFNSYYYRGNSIVHKSLAEASVESGNYAQAILSYEQLIKLEPENEEAPKEIERLKKLVETSKKED
ncbi:hypothetical protein JKA74_09615 [Marivirga sp. S37H4]|uniref:Thioredoxin n=1 Tax=Marivirga aurantiaca TaxID=2802615 RepID=A0A934WYN4_9BACT|nr:hypothetical protein [Marivirga aurantiaca]MBK6265297.1 hypothetical protein [Marivirga aurantiaca]